MSDVDTPDLISLARQVARLLAASASSAEDPRAVALARTFAEGASRELRFALADELKTSRYIPKDIAEIIARDSEDVASPFLRAAIGLGDELLECIVRTGPAHAGEAIAARDHVSEPVSYAISEVGSEQAVVTLMENPGAEISDRVACTATNRHLDCQALYDAMARRDDLPLSIVEIVLERASESFRAVLEANYSISGDRAAFLTAEAAKKLFNVVMSKAREKELASYFKAQMTKKAGLTPANLLTLLHEGNISAFLVAIHVLTKEPLDKVQETMKSGIATDVRGLLGRAGVPASMAPYFFDSLKALAT